jgi:hypothetical protein
MKTPLVLLLLFASVCAFAQTQSAEDGPKIVLTAKSTGNTWAALRDQSQEMAKNFTKDCPEIRITTNRSDADYEVRLSHIEAGLFLRDNQIAVVNILGDLLSTEEKGGIKGGVKGACSVILADWSDQASVRRTFVAWINAGGKRGASMFYAEVSGDTLTVHSERATAMRFHMVLADQREVSMMRHAGFATFVYTDDADQKFAYDVKAGQVLDTPDKAKTSSSSAPPSAP